MLKYRIPAAIASLAFAASLGGAALAAEPSASARADAPAAASSQAGDTATATATPTVESQTLGMEALGNARELGGYVGADGRTVKHDLLLRSAKLADASQADLDALVSEHNLGYVVDFRTSAERAQAPDPEIPGVENVWCSILDEDSDLGSMAGGAAGSNTNDGNKASATNGKAQTAPAADSAQAETSTAGTEAAGANGAAVAGGVAATAGSSATTDQKAASGTTASTTDNAAASSAKADAGSADARADQQAALVATVKQLAAYGTSTDLSDMYVDIADSAHSQQGYRQFFDVLLNADGKAVLWHCTGGKDRAGLGAALVLSALGVDRQTILDDFALTNDFTQQSIDAMVKAAESAGLSDAEVAAARDLAGVNRDYMAKALDHIDATYGSMHDYLVNQIGLTDDEIAQLQQMYLEA